MSPDPLVLLLLLAALSASAGRGGPDGEADLSRRVLRGCAHRCPFQNRTDDLGCGSECDVEQCVFGCKLWNGALESSCRAVCNVTADALSPGELLCVAGCNGALDAYFQTLRDEIGVPPAPALVADSLTPTSLSLEWEGSRRPGLGYLVQWRYEELAGAWQYCRNRTWDERSAVRVDGLRPYTKYRFRVAVLLSPRHGDPIVSASSVVIGTLPSGPPASEPTELRVAAVDSRRISLSWEPGAFPNGPVLSYVLRISENVTDGYSALKDLPASENSLFYMFRNLAPSTAYGVSVAMRNGEGEGPRARVFVTTPASPVAVASQQPVLILGGAHAILRQTADMLAEPTLLYNTSSFIRGIGIDVSKRLLFISDSSGSVRRASLSRRGGTSTILTRADASFDPLELSVDWLNGHLYVLGEVGGDAEAARWQIARCDYEGNSQTVAFAGFQSKPLHMEVDPYNGFLFWVLQSGGLFRLDLADISNGVKHEVKLDQILKEEPDRLGAFTVDHTNFRVLVSHLKNNTVLSVSLDGREVVDFRTNTQRPRFERVQSLSFANGLFYWTNGSGIITEEYHSGQNIYYHNHYPYRIEKQFHSVLIALPVCQPVPVAVNPPVGLQSVMDVDRAKITWQPPHLLGHQGNGAWQHWDYILEIKNTKEDSTIRMNISGMTSHIVKNLTENTVYIIKAAAVTSSGVGPWSSEFTAKTLSSRRNGLFGSMLWSAREGLLKSDFTGDNIQTLIHKSHMGNTYVTDISWYEDQLYLVTNNSNVVWYNMTSKDKGWIPDMENVGSLAVDWIGKKLYWSSPKQQLITRGNLRGGNREPVPLVTVGKELKIDSVNGFIYWNTGHAIECARLNGEHKITYYPAQLFRKQVMGLTVDLEGKLLYWIIHGYDGSDLYKAPTADSIMPNAEIAGTLISSLSNAATLGPLCYFSDRLIWLQDDTHAVISDVFGHNKANLNSITKANVNMIAIVDPNLQMNPSDEMISVIPEPVNHTSVKIVGEWNSFNITWDPTMQVNYGQIFYEIKIEYNNKIPIEHTTTEAYVSYDAGDVPPFSMLEMSIRPYTYWGAAPVVRVDLRSPQALPTRPTRPRIYIIHQNNLLGSETGADAVFRWDQPMITNGVIKGYRLNCWYVKDGRVQNVCNDKIVQPPQLQYVEKNISTNVTFYFQVRGFTDVGDGPMTEIVSASTDIDLPIPRLIISFHDSIKFIDIDLGDSHTISTGAGKPVDFAVNLREGLVYWLNEIQEIFVSKIHETGHNKLMSINGTGQSIAVDWIIRMLYWSQLENLPDQYGCTIYRLDLNVYETDRTLKIQRILQANNPIKRLQVSPITKSLYWIEVNTRGLGRLKTSDLKGSYIFSFFHQYAYENDSHVSRNNQCNCPEDPSVGKSFTLDLTEKSALKLFWIDAWMKHISSSDLNGCHCSVVVNATQNKDNALPAHFVTVDSKFIYWSNSSQKHLYSSAKDPKQNQKIQPFNTSSGQKMLSIEYKNQPLSPKICLSPKQVPLQVFMMNRTFNSITLKLPEPVKNDNCESFDLATSYYIIYYQPYEDESNCNESICTREKTFDRVFYLDGLRPFSKYVFTIQVSNYYGDLRNIKPVLGPPVVLQTSAGAPPPAENVEAFVMSPNHAIVQWSNVLKDNMSLDDDIWYEVHWRTEGILVPNQRVKEHNTFSVKTKPSQINISQTNFTKLIPSQSYLIWVRTHSNNSDIFTDSNTVAIETYPEPDDILCEFAGQYMMHVSWMPYKNAPVREFHIEYSESNSEIWNKVEDDGSKKLDGTINYVIHKLHPKIKYKFRLNIKFTNSTDAYIWPSESPFLFETLGDRPSPPGKPTIQHISDLVYQIQWALSDPRGSSIIQYRLFGDVRLNEEEKSRFHRNTNELTASMPKILPKSTLKEELILSRQIRETNYTQLQSDLPHFNIEQQNVGSMLYDGSEDLTGWKMLYNGTDNYWIVSHLKSNQRCIFYAQALNEYGWSNFSEPSEEFDFSEANMLAVKQNSIDKELIIMIIIVLIVFFVLVGCIYFFLCRKKDKKSSLRQSSPLNIIPRGLDVELATLRELPRLRGSGGMFQHSTNILYNNGLCNPPTDAEIALLPRIRRDQITLSKFLGSGAFGEVFEGKAKNLDSDGSETRVAVKTLRKGATDQEKTEFLQEAQLMSNFKHEHILSMLGVCLDNDPHFIIMELMEAGDLLSYLRARRPMLYTNDSLNLQDLLSMCMDVTKGCRYLEEMHFVHRDLACRNCLVSQQVNGRIVKIGDFGLARDIYKNDYYRKEGEGLLPVRWMAVECLTDGVFSRASDVWAWAVLCWEVATLGRQPYSALPNHAVMRYVRGGGTLQRPANCPIPLFTLLQKCWSYNPDQRPTFKYCLEVLDELIQAVGENTSLVASIDEEPQYITVVPDVMGINNRVYFVDENQNNECTGHAHISEISLDTSTGPQVQNAAINNPPKYLELLYDSDSAARTDGYEVPRSSMRSNASRSTLNDEIVQNNLKDDVNKCAIVTPSASQDKTLKVHVLENNFNSKCNGLIKTNVAEILSESENEVNSLVKLIPDENCVNNFIEVSNSESQVSDDEKISQYNKEEVSKLLNDDGFVRKSLKPVNHNFESANKIHVDIGSL